MRRSTRLDADEARFTEAWDGDVIPEARYHLRDEDR
jgi:hypothetical protein